MRFRRGIGMARMPPLCHKRWCLSSYIIYGSDLAVGETYGKRNTREITNPKGVESGAIRPRRGREKEKRNAFLPVGFTYG